MQKQIGISIQVSDDGQKVNISIVEENKPLAHAILESVELEELIEGLSAARSKMADPVPNEIEPSGITKAIDDPAWRTRLPKNAPKPGVLLLLRHPGLGWLSAFFPPHEAANLGQSLVQLAATPPK